MDKKSFMLFTILFWILSVGLYDGFNTTILITDVDTQVILAIAVSDRKLDSLRIIDLYVARSIGLYDELKLGLL